MSLLEIEDLRIGTSHHELVHGIDVTIEAGQWFGLIGESGSGKSLTAFAIADLLQRGLKRTARRMQFAEHDLTTIGTEDLRRLRGNRIAYVFQDYQAAFSPYYRIGRQLDEVLRAHTQWHSARRRERAAEVMDQLALSPDLLGRYPFQVSGGQLQRAALGAAILLDPDLLIADEPTTALDAVNASLVLDQIAAVQAAKGCAVLFITHNLRILRRFADDVAIMENGQIRERGSSTQVFEHPREAITRNLIAAIPPLRIIPARLPVFASEEDAA